MKPSETTFQKIAIILAHNVYCNCIPWNDHLPLGWPKRVDPAAPQSSRLIVLRRRVFSRTVFSPEKIIMKQNHPSSIGLKMIEVSAYVGMFPFYKGLFFVEDETSIQNPTSPPQKLEI